MDYIQHVYQGYVLEITSFGVDVRLAQSMIYVAQKVSMDEAISSVHQQLGVALTPVDR